MVVSVSHLVTFPDPIMSTLPAISPNTLALASGWNWPFLQYTFQNLDPESYGGCSAEGIAAYTRPMPSLRPQISKADATRWLTTFLADPWPSEKVKDALYHIRQVLSTHVWGPETLVQISRDLDTAFFGSCLGYRIRVSWEDVYTTLLLGSDLKKVLAVSDLDENKNTCHIILNRYGIQGGPIEPRMQTVQTLTHEMVHCWNFLFSRNEAQASVDTLEEWLSRHDCYFRWLLNLIDQRMQQWLGFGTVAFWEESIYRIADMERARATFPF